MHIGSTADLERRGREGEKVHGVPFRPPVQFKAHRLVYHSTLGLRVKQKKKQKKKNDLERRRRVREKVHGVAFRPPVQVHQHVHPRSRYLFEGF